MSSNKKRKYSRRWERQIDVPPPDSEALLLPNVRLIPRVEPQLVSMNDAAARFRYEELYTRETDRERYRTQRLVQIMKDYVDRCSFLLVIFDLFTSKKDAAEKDQWVKILSRALLSVPEDDDFDMFDVQKSSLCIVVPPRQVINYLWNVVVSYFVEKNLLDESDSFNVKENFHQFSLAHAALLGACDVFEYDLLRRGSTPIMSQIEDLESKI